MSGSRPQNVFVLNAGRVGSVTFSRACEHATNYTAAHESNFRVLGADRLSYPSGHIEIDNRLSWLLGRLDKAFGDDAWYVHLSRDRDAAVRSHAARAGHGIMGAYSQAIIWEVPADTDPDLIAADYLETVESNIELFLRDKQHTFEFRLEDAKSRFPEFWEWIGAEGDLDAALTAFDLTHNSGAEFEAERRAQNATLSERARRKLRRMLTRDSDA